MSIDYNKVRATIRLDNLRHNYRLLSGRAGRVTAVIKADAYGHGLVEVARALEGEGCEVFAVGTVEEGVKLRQSGCRGEIIALLGPMETADYPAMFEHAILPFVARFDQLAAIGAEAEQRGQQLDICLKFDTGMARLGFSLGDLPELADTLFEHPGIRPVLASSHLATADEPDMNDFVSAQAARFDEILEFLGKRGFSIRGTLANSGGILAHDFTHHGLQRAGIALYGTNPFVGTPWEDKGAGLRPGMEVSAPIVQVRDLTEGTPVSYGCTFRAPHDMKIAIVGAGYADNYSRQLSNKGQMCIGGRRVNIVGRVCMQLTAVDITALAKDNVPVRAGDAAWLLGGEGPGAVTADELAGWWGTITYEVFCLLGMNRRTFVE